MSSPFIGWGYLQIGWLLDEVSNSDGDIPDRYYPQGTAPEQLEAVRQARRALGHSISFVFTGESLHIDLYSGAMARGRVKNLEKIDGQLSRAIDTLSADKSLMALLSRKFGVDPEAGVGLHGAIEGMRRVQSAVRSLNKELSPQPLLDPPLATKQQIVFQRLAEVYRDGMDADPVVGISKTWNGHHGPFVAFVRAAFVLAGKTPQSDDALTKALNRHIIDSSADIR